MGVYPQEVIRRFTGEHAEDGTPVYDVTYTGRPKRPETVAEWAALRRAYLSMESHLPAGRVVLALLDAAAAGDAKAARAALDAGGELHERARHGVLLTLRAWVAAAAKEHPPAVGLAREMEASWVKRWGDKDPAEPQPRARRLAPR